MSKPTQERIKWSYVTHKVPQDTVVSWEKRPDNPRIGDVVLQRVLSLGKHTRMDNREGRTQHFFPGDLVAVAFGNRYATDQYEGFVPPAREQYHMLGIGGVCGMVGTKNESMPDPTVLEFVGYAIDRRGNVVNLRDHRLKPRSRGKSPRGFKSILSVGASMNSGKTTTAAMVIRGLARAGCRVAAAKLTGTAAIKDLHFMRDAGADTVIDFTHYGCPSTSRVSLRKLLRLVRTIESHLAATDPHFVVYEVADGIFQRETALLLSSEEFRSRIDYTFFSSPDSLAAEAGKRALERQGFPPIAFSGIVSASELGKQEVQTATGLPCLSSRELAEGGIVALLDLESPELRRKAV
ncbi:MAG TPA: hypothetical protein VJ826_05950 [Candidatus Polarisedimenticolaceae bacterium]|nr:hypothetical protein [Candidatus Polarisedimenticolaceae bacterium]